MSAQVHQWTVLSSFISIILDKGRQGKWKASSRAQVGLEASPSYPTPPLPGALLRWHFIFTKLFQTTWQSWMSMVRMESQFDICEVQHGQTLQNHGPERELRSRGCEVGISRKVFLQGELGCV